MTTYKEFLRIQEQWLDPTERYFADDEGDSDEAPMCEHCQAQGAEEHNSGCPNGDAISIITHHHEKENN